MIKALVLIEKDKQSYSAYSPNISGCVAVGKTREETEQRMYEALYDHIELLQEKNLPLPSSFTVWQAFVAFVRTHLLTGESSMYMDIPSSSSQSGYSYS